MGEITAIGRLEQSNDDLLEALAECEDDDFRQAVNENVDIVEQKKIRCALIAEKIRQLKLAEAAINPKATANATARAAGRDLATAAQPRAAVAAPGQADALPAGLDL